MNHVRNYYTLYFGWISCVIKPFTDKCVSLWHGCNQSRVQERKSRVHVAAAFRPSAIMNRWAGTQGTQIWILNPPSFSWTKFLPDCDFSHIQSCWDHVGVGRRPWTSPWRVFLIWCCHSGTRDNFYHPQLSTKRPPIGFCCFIRLRDLDYGILASGCWFISSPCVIQMEFCSWKHTHTHMHTSFIKSLSSIDLGQCIQVSSVKPVIHWVILLFLITLEENSSAWMDETANDGPSSDISLHSGDSEPCRMEVFLRADSMWCRLSQRPPAARRAWMTSPQISEN